MNEKPKNWLNWLALIPGVIAYGILITFPVHWVLYGILSFIEPYPTLPEKILAPFFSGIGMVYGAFTIAPKYKLETSLVICSICICSSLIGVYVCFTEATIGDYSFYLSDNIFENISMFSLGTGALCCIYNLIKNPDELEG